MVKSEARDVWCWIAGGVFFDGSRRLVPPFSEPSMPIRSMAKTCTIALKKKKRFFFLSIGKKVVSLQPISKDEKLVP